MSSDRYWNCSPTNFCFGAFILKSIILHGFWEEHATVRPWKTVLVSNENVWTWVIWSWNKIIRWYFAGNAGYKWVSVFSFRSCIVYCHCPYYMTTMCKLQLFYSNLVLYLHISLVILWIMLVTTFCCFLLFITFLMSKLVTYISFAFITNKQLTLLRPLVIYCGYLLIANHIQGVL